MFEDFLPIFTAKRDCIQGTPTKVTWVNPQIIRDCSLFMPKGGPVFRVGGGVKFSKSMKKGGVFLKYK